MQGPEDLRLILAARALSFGLMVDGKTCGVYIYI